MTKQLKFISALALSLSLGACGFLGTDDPDSTAQIQSGPVATESYSDNLSTEQISGAAALVTQANELLRKDLENIGDKMSDEKIGQLNQSAPTQALALYEEALVIAPGYGPALFGKATASTIMVLADPEMDDFLERLEEESNGNAEEATSASQLYRVQAQEAPQGLLQMTAKLQKAEAVTVEEGQRLVETLILPRLDSAISRLDTIMNHPDFSFVFTDNKAKNIEFDLAEVGPILAGLRIFKAYCIVIAGTDVNITMDGNYDWIDTLNNIRDEDFDNLRADQSKVLDHLTGLFSKGSTLGSVRPAWVAAKANIPQLLQDAIGNLQAGLRYAASESGTVQTNDPYVVGTGVDADVDPADLNSAADDLEFLRKYLTGEVAITYAKGSKTLKVNFPRYFQVTAPTITFLPYFHFRPYTEWNDIAKADTFWTNYSYLSWGENEKALLTQFGFPDDDKLNVSSGYTNDPLTGESVKSYAIQPSYLAEGALVNISSSALPCVFTYIRLADWIGGIAVPLASPETGSFTLSTCKVEAGEAQYVDWIKKVKKGVFVFTDAAGNATLSAEDADDVDSLQQLHGKVIFPDPTFGGVFPEVTNDNIWETLASFEDIRTRTKENCQEGYRINGDYEEWYRECDDPILPQNPSDLDRFAYWAMFLDQ